ncbi:hypothetical protein J3Q64DRAFT_1823701 [Phycomyces blakesleeanus]|uniref:Tc1-like transposase DDE domain-containing protein n=2 Tax=Phycomyces blakesleeanus TaxID=4837 RepID=A0A162N838_PHYB8|nr:hypothetical protein PHYBLDRAFT_174966 [Phycomyces blakesleeanus NRRL 1555(-)]OAD66674.1 hypothetical protein PHYBLDRAFT_174966 [Phycomyces blakesleeanus NRRL 1555(-)]|eukprot:XP_018284714.1 hypothetical protein PHYBLDRAFT_174966 [Phycomyces blakesleeanus NRRL 1555(-)]
MIIDFERAAGTKVAEMEEAVKTITVQMEEHQLYQLVFLESFLKSTRGSLLTLFDKRPTITLEVAREKLCRNLKGLEISIRGLHKHITREMLANLEERDKKIAFFIDEDGFQSQMTRCKGVAKKRNACYGQGAYTKGVNTSIIGCIASFDLFNFLKVDPIRKIDAEIIESEFHSKEENKGKKQKPNSQKEAKPKPKKGTTAYHIVKFTEATINMLERLDRRDYFIVTDD